MNITKSRQLLYDTVMRGMQENLIRMSAGNFSLRTENNQVLITPAGVDYQDLKVEDISLMDLDGQWLEGLRPSSETPMHTSIYRHLPHVGGICHTHSNFAITFALLGEDIPMANIELMVCGAPIPVAPWASPGTQKAGDHCVQLFQGRPELKAVLLRKHGLVTIGHDLPQAFSKAFNAEVGFQSYYQASMLGKPAPISPEEYKEIRDVYKF